MSFLVKLAKTVSVMQCTQQKVILNIKGEHSKQKHAKH